VYDIWCSLTPSSLRAFLQLLQLHLALTYMCFNTAVAVLLYSSNGSASSTFC
jgi:hypothetical protein